ncbi:dihydrolipoyllysine-residue acetyltransferase [Hyphomicrobium nitrativorans]|uniref:dihydrolipoyllysine-residue acetyltransferase n=1 Tax=Hyphomicrobium nitrativorans TaxID=1427356 RepID=UPI00059D3CE2|nr:dihydrolipoyllysine-residue acetyltransferase [Hyphomicrobium nitrativorans]
MSLIEVKVPNIGDYSGVPVIEVLVTAGDVVSVDDPLVTLESDKASMEIPAPSAGKVAEVLVNVGDTVSEGHLILRLEAEANEAGTAAAADAPTPPAAARPEADPDGPADPSPPPASSNVSSNTSVLPAPADFDGLNASPSVRRLARELDIDLAALKGTGEKGRITKADVKAALGGGSATGRALTIADVPQPDFSKFGPVTVAPLSRLKRLSGPHLHRAWVSIPHVTHTDEADITELETYRRTLDAEARAKGYRVTMLSFLMMASVATLKQFPEFNASLSPDGQSLILKRYYNIGVAVDTPDGLVVPVIKDADRKRILELSQELSTVSQRMRDGKIAPADIQGGTFSISSLGGIGGTGFTPIVNAPEVAILGVVRAVTRPVWNGETFTPRLMLPLCVSYDHRVIDGALAARFTRRLAEILGDVRQLVL